MPCQSCREFKEKHVRLKTRTVTKEEIETLGFDPDYSVPCDTPKDMPCPDGLNYCVNNIDCTQGTCPAATCPIPPKPNSHYVSNTCVSSITLSCVRCLINECRETGRCAYTGLCYYDCDAGYVWNGSDCVPTTVARGLGSGLNYISLIAILSCLHQKKRKKRRVIASILT